MLRALRARGGGCHARAADPDRPVPGERHRGRGRRHRRRRATPSCRPSWSTSSWRASTRATRPASSRRSASRRSTSTTIEEYTRRIAIELDVVGLMNIQYAIANDIGLRAGGQPARLAHRAAGVEGVQHPMARIATQLMLGKKLARSGPERRPIPHFGVKEAVFPFNMFPEVDPLLGPEMRSTGEVLGMAGLLRPGVLQGAGGGQAALPLEGTVLITVAERDQAGRAARRRGGSPNWASRSWPRTARKRFLAEHGVAGRADPQAARGPAQHRRRHQERRDPAGDQYPGGQVERARRLLYPQGGDQIQDPVHHHHRRRVAAARGIAAERDSVGGVRSLQMYHATLTKE